jgi:beta-phosphoglucomutase-like phosphatase (HAD superfamily)
MNSRILPLCVDLDGTLIASDTLWESVLILLRRSPWLCFLLPIWLMKGRSFLKSKVADHVELSVENLPYRPDVLAFLKQQKAQGPPLNSSHGRRFSYRRSRRKISGLIR